jgi:hypothetical protein
MAEQYNNNCTFVNPFCPDDLCVLHSGHPFASRGRHITGTRPGSANTSWAEQLEILRDPEQSGWAGGYLAPKDTSDEDLILLGWELQQRMGID